MKQCIDQLEKMNSAKDASLNSSPGHIKIKKTTFKELADLMKKKILK